VREMVALLVKLPEVPVTVTVKVPVAAVLLADKVKRLEDAVGFVPKLALTPLGRPDAVRFTLPLNPLAGLIVIVVEPDAAWRKVRLTGDAESVKLGCGVPTDQLLTKFAALRVPMPVAKSQPMVVP
jgi:hypothetical protein